MRTPPSSSATALALVWSLGLLSSGCASSDPSFGELLESYCRDQLAGKIHGVVSIGEEGEINDASVDSCMEQVADFRSSAGVSEESYLAYIDCSREAESDDATRACATKLLDGARL